MELECETYYFRSRLNQAVVLLNSAKVPVVKLSKITLLAEAGRFCFLNAHISQG